MDYVLSDKVMLQELRDVIHHATERGLIAAARWASELVLSIPKERRDNPSAAPLPTQPSLNTLEAPGIPQRHPTAPKVGQWMSPEQQEQDAQLELEELDYYNAGRALFDNRDFARAAAKLEFCKSSKGMFLKIYSEFLGTEKACERDWHKLDGSRDQPQSPINQYLPSLLAWIGETTDPWLCFLKAILLARLSQQEAAIENCIIHIAAFPWNWSAWTLLASCIGDPEELSSLLPLLPLPPIHPLVQMFQIKTLNELHQPSENELRLCETLLAPGMFPESAWIMSARACVLYHLHDFQEAEKQFDKVFFMDPFRVDDLDVYSNILYVTESRLKLSKLAHECLSREKDRPEICCLVGNHYSLRTDHEKAIRYFRRATQLDRTYLAAWTLLGHEYVEIKNAHAAIDSYRRAVDVSKKDYRAWYGLGQAYELLNMHQYALYYYQRATALRPYDVRLWQAHAACYQELGRPREAIDCLKRALLSAEENETSIHLKLAELYTAVEERGEASAYHQRVCEICFSLERPAQDYAKSAIFVAVYHMGNPQMDLEKAQSYLERVANSNAEEVAKATDLLKTVRGAIKELAQSSAAMSGVGVGPGVASAVPGVHGHGLHRGHGGGLNEQFQTPGSRPT